MIIFLQFTLTDLRSFTTDIDDVLSKPGWPSPSPSQFVRGTGRVRPRRRMGLKSWVHEGYLCEIKRGIGSPTLPVASGLKNVYRNFYSGEELVLNRYEFVFRTDKKQSVVNLEEIQKVVQDIFDAELSIKLDGRNCSTKILSLPKKLKKFHWTNTTPKAKIRASESEKQIISCEPQLYLLLDEEESIDLINSDFKVYKETTGNFNLYSKWLEYGGRSIKLWVHERSNHTVEDSHRKLRISIQRIFSEQSCLKNVFDALKMGKLITSRGSRQSDKLQGYFNTAISTFLKDKNHLEFENNLTGFSDEFSSLFDNFLPGDLEQLRLKIMNSDFRPAITKKTENYMSSIYNINNAQIGAVGDNSKAENTIFNQNNSAASGSPDFEALATELKKLRTFLQGEAKTDEELAVLDNIALAQQAAEEKQESRLLKYLKGGTSWALAAAEKIGVTLAAALIKDQMMQP